MKTLFTVFLCLASFKLVDAQSPISPEEFDKIKDPVKREQIISQAPAAQRAELERLDLHHRVLTVYGDEQGLKLAKQISVARAHGFPALTSLFMARAGLRQHYFSGQLLAYAKFGAPDAKIRAMEGRSQKELDESGREVMATYDLVFRLAITPQALTLESRAKQLINWIDKIEETHRPPDNPITEKDQAPLNKEVDELLFELKKLPQKSPATSQKEYDEVSDERLYRESVQAE